MCSGARSLTMHRPLVAGVRGPAALAVVYMAAISGCGGSGSQETYDPITTDIKTLQSEADVQAKRIAANRLASNAPMPDSAIDPLLAVITNEREDEEVRCSAARALSKNDNAIDKLIAAQNKLQFGPVKDAVGAAASRP